jgi:hypothetical protein
LESEMQIDHGTDAERQRNIDAERLMRDRH